MEIPNGYKIYKLSSSSYYIWRNITSDILNVGFKNEIHATIAAWIYEVRGEFIDSENILEIESKLDLNKNIEQQIKNLNM